MKSQARRLVALLVCRLYAVLPCIITPLVAGGLSASGRGVILGGALVLLSFLIMAIRFPDFLERKTEAALNALIYFVIVSLPAAAVPLTGLAGFLAGFSMGTIESIAVVTLAPRLPPRFRSLFQPELFPDVLTGLVLSALFVVPIRFLRPSHAAWSHPRPPFEIAVIVCAFEEEATIDRCLASIKEAVARLAGSPLSKRVRVVLVDSSADDVTRRRVAPQVDRVIHGEAGKLSARHQAMLAETADIMVAVDADRCYDPDWLTKLIAPFEDSRVVATMGETRNVGAGMSASALCRATLKLPYNGGNSAFFRSAYLTAPFAISLDQGRHKELWLEEEFLFGLTLQAQGLVVHVADCRSYELRPYPLLAQLSRHLFGVRLRTF